MRGFRFLFAGSVDTKEQLKVNVYIFGGERLDYFTLQLRAIEMYLKPERAVYVQGPCHSNRSVASQAMFHESAKLVESTGKSQVLFNIIEITHEHVRPGIKSTRLANIAHEVCRSDGFGDVTRLFLHGDLIPYAPFDADEVLGEFQYAGPLSYSMQWFLTRGPNHFHNVVGTDDFMAYAVAVLDEHQQRSMFNNYVPGLSIFDPHFLHLNNYSGDFDSIISKKLKMLEDLLT